MMRQILILSALLSTYGHAHPGHDHAHWVSEPIHILTGLAVLAIVITGIAKYISIKKEKDAS